MSLLWGQESFENHFSLPHSAKRQNPPVKAGLLVGGTVKDNPPQLTFPETIQINNTTIELLALVDSGEEQNLLEQLPSPITEMALDGGILSTITHKKNAPIILIVSGNHCELIEFLLFPGSSVPMILCFPWLALHNSHILWSDRHVESLKSALQSPSPPPSDTTISPVDLSLVLTGYQDLGSVFSKVKALSLPPHRPYECTIDLLPGAPLPSSQLYNLSRPKREAMELYIRDSLATGIIRPSSAVRAGFFFVLNKDKSLRPCIDYRGLNQITVKNKYPLPLISSAFEPIQGATI